MPTRSKSLTLRDLVKQAARALDAPVVVNIDLDALIAAQRASRDEWPATRRFAQAAMVEAVHRKRRRAARRRWRIKYVARPRRQTRPAPGQRRRDQVLGAMLPGEWYAVPDVVAASGVPYRSVQPTLYQRLEPEGLVERAQNEAWYVGALTGVPKHYGGSRAPARLLGRWRSPSNDTVPLTGRAMERTIHF
jgi:hypothetical protein